MSFYDDQNEQPLPVNGKSKRKSESHLPRYYRTQANKKFLSSTLDQLIQPGVVEKINGYVGRKTAKAFTTTDSYVEDVSKQRQDYQFEPAAVVKDNLDNVVFYKDYNDYMNQIANFNNSNLNHSTTNRQEYYSWDPHINWDMFTNFREYYWLPNGPQGVAIPGETIDVESTYTVRLADNLDNKGYVFSPDGLTQNPTITLYRGVTYKFDLDVPNLPFTIKTKRTLETDFDLDSSSILIQEGLDIQGLEKGVATLQLSTDTPEILYYVSSNDINASGTIIVKNLEDATFLDVEKDIIGKKNYKASNGVSLSNGMKVYFSGEVYPESYAQAVFYVAGVGDKIRLVPEENLNVPSEFADDITVPFDSLGFDRLPFSSAIGYPVDKDYIVISRSSQDGNLWSRYNRWFHRDVIEKSAAANNQPIELDQDARAKRPIIEFEPNIKLFQFGTKLKKDVDLVDDFTKDVFSIIEGSQGYNIDGIDVTNGMRILFTADQDVLVNGRVFEVEFIKFSSGAETNNQIHLKEVSDSVPVENEVLLALNGQEYKGTMLYYNGTQWNVCQSKTSVNQPPLFEMFDVNDKSYADLTVYNASTFKGNKIFSYKEGTGTNDIELGFPLTYRSIENSGDIVFDFNYVLDNMTYTIENELFTLNTDIAFLRKYTEIDTYETVSGWQKVNTFSEQPVIRQYIFDNSFTDFEIDVYDNSASLNDIWIRVYKNNDLQFENKDYELIVNSVGNYAVRFIDTVNINDVVIIKTRSAQAKNENGYYEIPAALERNPKNELLQEFTLGEVNDHVQTIVEQVEGFDGVFPGKGNLRDLGMISNYGRRFLQHSVPLNLPLFHFTDDNANALQAIRFAKKRYSTFKRTFLSTAEEIQFTTTTVREQVDEILKLINKNYKNSSPFYFSDMMPLGASNKITYTVIDADETFFAITDTFDKLSPSRKAVTVYLNDTQLVHGRDYTFNNEGYVIVTATKAPDDIIDIFEYETTNGSFVPPTPTKLGLFPQYEPTTYIDDTYINAQKVIQGHDGSLLVAFNDFRDDLLLELEKRIYNNIKVEYDKSYFDIHKIIGGYYRDTNITQKQIDKIMLPDFVQWSKFIDQDYTKHSFFDRENRLTFNYKDSKSPTDAELVGWWRGIYKQAYDTDRPHTHPWEMLGFTIKPSWWEDEYGSAPYTSNNLLMWEDIEAGLIRNETGGYTINKVYSRPGLTTHLPVDEHGLLVSPLDSGFVRSYVPSTIDFGFTFGDHSPVETAWRRSAEYPFSLLVAIIALNPSYAFSGGFDRFNQKRNNAGAIIYKPTNKRLQLKDIIFPNTYTDSTQIYTSGIVNYVANFMAADVLSSYDEYKNNIKSIDNQLGFKLAGFTDKSKFKLILDSRNPLNEGNVFIPEENFKVFLNTSSPVEYLTFSGVIVERRSDGYVIKGYDTSSTAFKYYQAFQTQSDPSVNVGGVSESFVYWDTGKTYAQGLNVEHQGTYYRVTNTHQSGSEFDESNFAKLPYLPLIGGRDAFIRKSFNKRNVLELEYGSVLETTQDVVDFLLGYGAWLEDNGFVFDYFEGNEAVVLNWRHSVNEFLFWSTQNWGEGSVLALSPASAQLRHISEYTMADNIYDGFFGYTLLKSDGSKLDPEFSSIGRQPNEFILRPKNTADGIFSLKIPLVQKEHVILLDNTTVFNDVIYDLQPGYRQERIRILGYRTTEWDGSLNIPGFIYDDAMVVDWSEWTDYPIGSVVKYKEFYYSANKKIAGSADFNANEWNRLSEKPEVGLFANFDYKVNQFGDFYDLDSDNFDVEQQKVAQHLIGYQKRKYLDNIIEDDVSQYKFYQGMIQEKGTKNALTKLFDALASDEKDSLEFFEEWAIKDGQYGATDGFDEVEYILDESKFRLKPQPIELVQSVVGDETDLVYRILPYEVYQKSKNYNHAPYPEKIVDSTYTKASGYVNLDDVKGIVTFYNNIVDFNFADIKVNEYIWVGDLDRNWSILRHLDTDYNIEQIQPGETEFVISIETTPRDINVGDVIGINNCVKQSGTTITQLDINGFFEVKSKTLNKITLTTSTPITIEESNITGNITRFAKVRASNVDDANTIMQKDRLETGYIWIDNLSQNDWAVLENKNKFGEQGRIANPSTADNGFFAQKLAVNDRNTTMIVGVPDSGDGKVYVYNRAAESISWVQTQIIEPIEFADPGQKFGGAVSISPDGEYLIIGSPSASNVKTKYQGGFVESQLYTKGSIVLKDQGLWQSVIDILPAVDNIAFNSFYSVTQAIEELDIETTADYEIKTLLTGNYAISNVTGQFAFSNIPVNHLLVRAPKELYQGSGVNDQIKLAWNTITTTNQDVPVGTVVQPFAGQFAAITESFIEGEHTIQKKIDAVMYINASTNQPIVGDLLQTTTGQGIVDYVFANGAELIIYLKDVNGTFNTADSLFRDDGDFIGEYALQGPVDPLDTTDVYGGYWWIDTPTYIPTNITNNADDGRGLVYYDVISDSSATGRYYYNILDNNTTDISSQNTFASYIKTLSYQGLPGAFGSNDGYTTKLYVVRAPSVVTDIVSPGDQVSLYVNQLPLYGQGIQSDLVDINLTKSITNKTQTIYDVWDGYINLDFTKFDAGGNVFEPIPRYQYVGNEYVDNGTGQTVRDVTTGATGEVVFYERNNLNATIYVKGIAGTWSDGDDYGQNAEIEFLAIPGSTQTTYQADRVMGQIQFVSLGYPSSGIGKLLVFEAPAPVAVPTQRILQNAEYWVYQQGTVLGIPRSANPPSASNNEWTQVYKIPADATGTGSGFTNEGLYSIYSKARPGTYDPIGSYTVPEKASNLRLGSNIEISKSNELYRAFIGAAGDETQSLPGRIYFVKKGDENNQNYDWEYAKDKQFKGPYNENIPYFTGDIVYIDQPDGTLYIAKTNLAPGLFNINDWTSTDDLTDYVGFVPNNTGRAVINDSTDGSTVLDQTGLISFGNVFEISSNGEVLVTTAKFTSPDQTKIIVYRNNRGQFNFSQEIVLPDASTGFGHSVALSADGMHLAISAPYDDELKNNQGIVYVYKQVSGEFTQIQTLYSPNNERGEMFGWRLQFDGNRLSIAAKNTDAKTKTSFDGTETQFDNGFTTFRYLNEDSGVIYVYERIAEQLLFAQTIQVPDRSIQYFGQNFISKNNHILVGLPKFSIGNTTGAIIDFRLVADTMYEKHREVKPTVDIDKLKKVYLYNTKEKEIITYLDYIDPLQGKVAGPAEQDLTYKTYYDPASYSIGNNFVTVDASAPWGEKQVGEVWWDLTNAKFFNPYQGDVIYSTQQWNKIFEGNTIDVYEWVKSDILPSEWDSQADTEKGFAKGYSGTSLYGDDVYSFKRTYDEVAQTFSTTYYFWVKNKKTIPNVEFRNTSIADITSLIQDPIAAGHRFVAYISPKQFVLFNCDDLIKGKEVAFSTQFWTIDNQTQNIHNQYQIVTEGLETSQPNKEIINKWFHSLIGYDEQKRSVPDPDLSPKYRYGTLFTPRQGWFVNRAEALKQFLERVNMVLKENLIVDDKDISPLFLNDPQPTESTNLYDTVVDSIEDLQFIGVAKATRATVTPVIADGKIIRVEITDPGRGYRKPPTISVYGKGSGAEFTTTIDSVGKITNVNVVNTGKDYADDTILNVRKFTALVTSDSSITGRWALYERNTETRNWSRSRSQAYDVSLYWNYIDWYASGYSSLTNIDYLIENTYELDIVQPDLFDVVKIKNVGTGGWLLLRKIDTVDTDDVSVNYETIGRQNGTIEFKSTLYDVVTAFTGFDTINFDTKIYDNEPVDELRIILNTIKDNLFTEELKVKFNDLFFAGLRYVFAEQNYVDWAFKTSFVKAKHNVGTLREDVTFNNDNLPSYEDYIKEVKPFKTKIREYLSAYEKIDNTNSVITDFDLPPYYNDTEGKITPNRVTVSQDVLIGVDANIEDYPNRNWLDNSSYGVVKANVVVKGQGYTSAPVLKVVGGGGSGAELQAFLGRNGSVSRVEVVNPGSGYYSLPSIEINGNLLDDGVEARVGLELGNNPIRKTHTIIKFDRVSGTYKYIDLDVVETFTNDGNTYNFDLKWPMDLNTNNITVYINNIEALSSEYTFTNIEDETKGYTRRKGRIILTELPAKNSSVRIEYKKNIDLLEAHDRINQYYTPMTGMPGKELTQLMNGVDYGGVQVKSFGFGNNNQGWDAAGWYAENWDTYDTTFEDEIFEFDGSTIEITLNKPLEQGIAYNVYIKRSGQDQAIRLDDPLYDGSTVTENPNAIMQTIIGDGVTQTMYLDDFKLSTYQTDGNNTGVVIAHGAGDVLTIRKSTSDGTFLPSAESYDSLLSGGALNYSTATGLDSADITIDGDGFVTPTTSGGPEEVVPGQVLDTVDLQVYERPKGGASNILAYNFRGDGSKTEFNIAQLPTLEENIFVKINNDIIDNDQYEIDYNNKKIIFNSAPADTSRVTVITLGESGTKILDIIEITSDGSTSRFLTNVKWEDSHQFYVSVDGVKQNAVITESDVEIDGVANLTVIDLAEAAVGAKTIKYVIAEGTEVGSFSEVTETTIIADGSSLSYNVDATIAHKEPISWFTVVKVNNRILNPGYNQIWVGEEGQYEYKLKDYQIPPGTTTDVFMKVYLNDRELTYPVDWTYLGSVGATSSTNSTGNLIRLSQSLNIQDGDDLRVYITNDGEYRFGFFDAGSIFNPTPNTLYLDNPYNENDVITVYSFTNHDYQGIERQNYDVVERFPLTSETSDWYEYLQLNNGLIKLRKPAFDAQYVWVSKNGVLLNPSVDYYVTDNKMYVKIISQILENDVIDIIQFTNAPTKNKFGWRQFKDILNRNHYKRLDGSLDIRLAKDLHSYDQSITVTNADNLPAPIAGSDTPAVIFVNGERIEYFVRTDNVITQIRRGTLGTGVKDVYPAGLEIYNQSSENTMPYKDETITTIFDGDGTSTVFELDFTPNSVNEFEVFVAGQRLRKNSISSYQHETYDSDGNKVTDFIELDSPEGDITLPAQFTINGSQLVLLEPALINTKVIVVRRKGKLWTDPGTPLADSDSDIGSFLRAKTVDLPR